MSPVCLTLTDAVCLKSLLLRFCPRCEPLSAAKTWAREQGDNRWGRCVLIRPRGDGQWVAQVPFLDAFNREFRRLSMLHFPSEPVPFLGDEILIFSSGESAGTDTVWWEHDSVFSVCLSAVCELVKVVW